MRLKQVEFELSASAQKRQKCQNANCSLFLLCLWAGLVCRGRLQRQWLGQCQWSERTELFQVKWSFFFYKSRNFFFFSILCRAAFNAAYSHTLEKRFNLFKMIKICTTFTNNARRYCLPRNNTLPPLVLTPVTQCTDGETLSRQHNHFQSLLQFQCHNVRNESWFGNSLSHCHWTSTIQHGGLDLERHWLCSLIMRNL